MQRRAGSNCFIIIIVGNKINKKNKDSNAIHNNLATCLTIGSPLPFEINHPTQGIRYYENSNIDATPNIARVKARQYYGEHQVIDVEAAMLSNHCTAVIQFREKQQRTRENKKYNSGIIHQAKSRKSYTGHTITLAERKDHEHNQKIKRESNT